METETETQQFLADMLPKQASAERAMHNGQDARLFSGRTTTRHPVRSRAHGVGLEQSETQSTTVASWFSDRQVRRRGCRGRSQRRPRLHRGYEHNVVTSRGEQRAYTLRVTHVYRREDGEWKIVHRHADAPPDTTGSPAPIGWMERAAVRPAGRTPDNGVRPR